MIGRRLPIPDDGEHVWAVPTDPGDYCGPVDDANGLPTVWFLLPGAFDEDAPPEARGVCRITSPPWTFRECDDGSLEIRASIAVLRRDGSHAWHGFLDEGHVWRVC